MKKQWNWNYKKLTKISGRGGFGEEVDRLRCSNFRDLTRKIFQLVSWIGGRMTYSLERVHFISIFLCLCLHDTRNDISFPIQVIPEFNPNETVVLVQDFILVSCKLRSNFLPDWLCFWSGAKTPRAGTPLTESFDVIILSLWNKTHFGMKVIPVSYEHPLGKSKFTRQGIIVATLKQSFNWKLTRKNT